MNKRKNKAMSVVEYSLLFAVVIAAILGAQIYLKRAISGRWKEAADTFGYGRQYDPKTDPQYTGPQFNLWGNQ